MQWMRDSLHLIDQSKRTPRYFAAKALGSNEVYVVPAFWWD